MRDFPLKQCPKCNLYSDLSVEKCICGADISGVPGVIPSPMPGKELWATVNETLPFYVQKCPVCTTENYTPDPAHRIRLCRSCHRRSVFNVEPVRADGQPPKDPQQTVPAVPPVEIPVVETPSDGGSSYSAQPVKEEQSEEERQLTLRFLKMLNDANNTHVELSENSQPVPSPRGQSADPQDVSPGPTEVDDPQNIPSDPADIDDPSWDLDDLVVENTLTATAIGCPDFHFELTPSEQQLPYMLGRDAHGESFLSYDRQIGNRHCYISYRDGNWVVTDNNSANGTGVNGQFLAFGGSQILHDGDILKLGHRDDSMSLRISIGG